jgi:hypothetical protein
VGTINGVLKPSVLGISDDGSARAGRHAGTNTLSARVLRNKVIEETGRSIVGRFKIGAIFVELECFGPGIAVALAIRGLCATSIACCLICAANSIDASFQPCRTHSSYR